MPDYYKVLQVDPEADAEVVTAAYRALARRLHPDRDITGVEEYRMSELNRAYAVLRDAKKRRQYDAERALKLPVGPGGDGEDEPLARSGGLAARWQAHERAAASPTNGSGQPAEGPGETLLPFGRYAGMTLRQIAAKDTEYLRWLGRHSSGLRYRREIEQVLRESLDASYSPRESR
ncbi:MAG TPA: DnaJ domain-containing protein [Candidatus Limnocylindrales bacterium]|nr:DnaJ domain-containing protein [Candidatus Limnocylindrales bacterium]